MAGPGEQVVMDSQGNEHHFPGEATPEMIARALGVKPPGVQTPPSPPSHGAGGSWGPPALSRIEKMWSGAFHPEPVTVESATESLPMVGGAIGGMTGGVTGALIGGTAGSAVQQGIRARFGEGPVKTPAGTVKPGTVSGTAPLGATLEGLKQGAYELGGRVIGAVGGRIYDKIRGIPAPPVAENIAGEEIPLTAGQAVGKPGGFLQSVEHYLSGVPVGEPLKEVRRAQEAGARTVTAKLAAGSTEGAIKPVTTELADNWARAREVSRAQASPLYESLGGVETPQAGQVAADILKDDTIKLGADAKKALATVARDPRDIVAQGLGYENTQQAIAKLGQKTFDQSIAKFQEQGIIAAEQGGVTASDVIKARHELGKLASTSHDPYQRMVVSEARNRLDSAINAALTPEQLAVKQQADTLWRRSYIQDRMFKQFSKMELPQNPADQPKVLVQSFNRMVNQLARQKVVRTAEGGIVKEASDLARLFPNPEDRQAMMQLANFLTTKHATLHGAAGISESIARIGVTLEAARIPLEMMTGRTGSAVHAAQYIAGLMGASHILAHPGGAVALYKYFSSAPAAQVALAGRLVGFAEGNAPREQGEGVQTPPAPPQ